MTSIFKKPNFFFFLFVLFSGCYPDDIIIPYSFPTTQTSSATEFACSRQYYNAHDFTSGRRLWNTQEKTSNDGRTKIVINTYFANTHTISQIEEGKNANHLSVSVDPDEVLVGGGAAVFVYNADDFNWTRNMFDLSGERYYAFWWENNKSRWDNVHAFISSSYPVDDNSFSTWAADSKGMYSDVQEYKHHLKVTAVGMKVFYDGQLIPSASLKANMDISSSENSNLGSGYGNTPLQFWNLTPAVPKWFPLAVGAKTCWTENGDGWFLSRIFIDEWNNSGNFYTSGNVIREKNTLTSSKATAKLFCLTIRNVNPNDNSKPLFKYSINYDYRGTNNGNGLIQRFEISPTDFSQLVLSAFGGMYPSGGTTEESFKNVQTIAISSLSPTGYGDCWPYAAELVTKYRFTGLDPAPPSQFSQSQFAILQITPN